MQSRISGRRIKDFICSFKTRTLNCKVTVGQRLTSSSHGSWGTRAWAQSFRNECTHAQPLSPWRLLATATVPGGKWQPHNRHWKAPRGSMIAEASHTNTNTHRFSFPIFKSVSSQTKLLGTCFVVCGCLSNCVTSVLTACLLCGAVYGERCYRDWICEAVFHHLIFNLQSVLLIHINQACSFSC